MDVESNFSKIKIGNDNGKRTSESSGSYTVSNSAARMTFSTQRNSKTEAETGGDHRQPPPRRKDSEDPPKRVRPSSTRSERSSKKSANIQVAQNKAYMARVKIHANIPASMSAGKTPYKIFG